MTEAGNLLLVRQYKQGVDAIVWELPGGTPKGREDPCTTGARELWEETGYRAPEIILTGTFPIHTRKSPSVFNTLLALGCRPVGPPLFDQDELIEVAEVTPAEFWCMVRDNLFKEPQSIIAVVKAALLGHVPFSCV